MEYETRFLCFATFEWQGQNTCFESLPCPTPSPQVFFFPSRSFERSCLFAGSVPSAQERPCIMQKTRWILDEPHFKAAPYVHVRTGGQAWPNAAALSERARGLKKCTDLETEIKWSAIKESLIPVAAGCCCRCCPGWGSCWVNIHCSHCNHQSAGPNRRNTFRFHLTSSQRSTCVLLEAVQHWVI